MMGKVGWVRGRVGVTVFLLAALAVAGLVVDGRPAGAGTCVSTVSGPWVGTHSSYLSGSWNADFNFSAATAPDTASGTFNAPGVTAGPYTATVTCAGVLDLTANTPGGTVLFHSDAFNSSDQSASGTWQYGSFAGGWQGSLV